MDRQAFPAFLSYAHLDDENSGGRILELARRLRGEFHIQTGQELTIFVDRDEKEGIRWGDEWAKVIETNLGYAAFLIPVISPTYLSRPECRREFISFRTAAVQGQVEKLILPILFADISGSREDDEIVRIARSLQWRDWTRLRLHSFGFSDVTTEIPAMAGQLMTRMGNLPSTSDAHGHGPRRNDDLVNGDIEPEEVGRPEDSAEDLGLTDKIAEAEDALPQFVNQIGAITASVKAIGEVFQRWTPQVTKAKSFRDRVSIYRSMAAELGPMVEEFHEDARLLDSFATTAAPGINALLGMIAESDEENESVSVLLENTVKAADAMKQMAKAAGTGRQHVQKAMVNSRDLRQPLSTYLEGVEYVVSASTTASQWGRRASDLLISR